MTKLRIRHGEDELEVDGTDEIVQAHIETFYKRLDGKLSAGPAQGIRQRLLETAPPTEVPRSTPSKAPTPAEFYRSKGSKADGLSQVLVFGKYLEEFENMREFGQADINRVAKEARLSKDIHPQYFTNAVKQGLLRKSGKKYSLTLSAEEALASM